MAVAHHAATGLPDSYRIALAFSVAILLHTLILAGLPYPQPDPPKKRHQLTLELVNSGSTLTTASHPATAADTQPRKTSRERNPRFDIPDTAPGKTPAPEPVMSATSPRLAPEPSHVETIAEPDEISPEPDAQYANPSKPASIPSQAAEAGTTRKTTEKTELTRITQSPTQQDPYLIRLASHLAKELEQLRVPAVAQLADSARMEIELQLMKNGALTRARVVKSTGIKEVDTAAYRAALAASPYPKPPAESATGDRFEVELVFSPKRL